jgi:hypothetical protein
MSPPDFVRCARSLDFYAWTLRSFRGLDKNKRDYYEKMARCEFSQERALRGTDRVRALHEKGVIQVTWLLKKYGAPPPSAWDATAPLQR